MTTFAAFERGDFFQLKNVFFFYPTNIVEGKSDAKNILRLSVVWLF